MRRNIFLPSCRRVSPCLERVFQQCHFGSQKLTLHSLGLQRLNQQTVRGLALRPDDNAFRKLTAYNEATAIQALADPCAYSCQKLIPQLGGFGNPQQLWDWRVSFGPASVLGGVATGNTTAGQAPVASGSNSAGLTGSAPTVRTAPKASGSKTATSQQPTAGRGLGSRKCYPARLRFADRVEFNPSLMSRLRTGRHGCVGGVQGCFRRCQKMNLSLFYPGKPSSVETQETAAWRFEDPINPTPEQNKAYNDS